MSHDCFLDKSLLLLIIIVTSLCAVLILFIFDVQLFWHCNSNFWIFISWSKNEFFKNILFLIYNIYILYKNRDDYSFRWSNCPSKSLHFTIVNCTILNMYMHNIYIWQLYCCLLYTKKNKTLLMALILILN